MKELIALALLLSLILLYSRQIWNLLKAIFSLWSFFIILVIVLRVFAWDYANIITNDLVYGKPAYTYILKYNNTEDADCFYYMLNDYIKQQRWDISVEDFLLVIYSESQFNPKAVNKQKGDSNDPLQRVSKRATGIIQFMPSTAKNTLKTTTLDIYYMDICKQLMLTFTYLAPYKARIHSAIDLKIAILYPLSLGKDIVISKTTDNAAYYSNIGLDTNNDYLISKLEIERNINKNKSKIYGK